MIPYTDTNAASENRFLLFATLIVGMTKLEG
jgi:hypothetical protein